MNDFTHPTRCADKPKRVGASTRVLDRRS
jgi:hypothetical protein